MTQGINEQIGAIPAIEAELHLVQIGREMLRADLVPRSHDAALQQGECGFDGVRRNASAILIADVFTCAMVDDLMFFFADSVLIGGETIRNKHVNVGTDVLSDVLCQCSALGIFGVEEPQIAIALAKADDDFLCRFSGLCSPTFFFPPT